LELSRFYCESITTGHLRLDAVESHHIIHVLRLVVGERIELFDGRGTVAKAVISDIARKTVTVQVDNIRTMPSRTAGQIVIATSTAKAQRLDWLITKCTELGIDHIALVLFERTVKQAAGRSALQRYEKLAIAAAKQCGRIFLPKITGPLGFTETLEGLKKQYQQAQLIFGSLSTDAAIIDKLPNNSNVIAFVGPEGGFTNKETTLLKGCGAIEVRLSDTVLRVETAAIAFAAILSAARLKQIDKSTN